MDAYRRYLMRAPLLMFALAAWLTPGFSVAGFGPAFWGGLLYAVLAIVISWMVNTKGPAKV